MAAPVQSKLQGCVVGVPLTETSTHLDSASVRLASRSSRKQACSIIENFTSAPVQSELQVCLIGVPEAETSTHLDSASASHHGQART